MKKEYLILALLIAALSSYIVLKSTDREQYSLPRPGDVAKDEITAIDIEKNGNVLSLQKQGDTWGVTENRFPVDKDKLDTLLTTLEKLDITALVSESRDFLRYDLGPEKKIKVTVKKDSQVLREFEIGKTAPTYKHTFVRLAGDDRVYHAAGNFRSQFDDDIDGFRDKKILSFDSKTIQGIRVEKDGLAKELKVARTDSDDPERSAVWTAPDGSTLDTQPVERLVSTLSRLECSGYTGQESKERLDSLAPLCTITLMGEKQMTVSLYDKTDTKSYPALSSETPYLFYLDSRQGEALITRIDTILGIENEPEKNGN